MKPLVKISKIIMNTLIFLVFAFPFFWLVSSSLKTLGETLTFPPSLFPEDPQWENYRLATESMPFFHYLKNSVIVSVATVVLQLVSVTLAAYAFARYSFKGKNLAFGTVIVTMMVPTQLTFLTIYVMFAELEMINTYSTLILPSATSALGYLC
ncbi:carbohydrate ABC transporter permease [Fundicoccus culcitae]|uniref:Carbohydrate ABC transporter permease n=1 Tax=Fundicoccus culcitae TaxID=2969821 RepID=A0ABY5P3X3_9LACT|nr:carbohydrate ABC transporter permease [Fundicoccus culcitae]UUX33185.1 carbohydrate ABC transporter permease [Fundicoccus culcitae]